MDVGLKQEIEQVKNGCLITQIARTEFNELVVQLLDESLSIDALSQSDKKKDRTRAKKLLLLGNLLQESPDHLTRLLNTKWRTLFFRSAVGHSVQCELELYKERQA